MAATLCPTCEGTGWRSVEQDGARAAVRCDCWRDGLTTKLLVEARIQPRYKSCEIGNFALYENETLKRAVKKAQAFADAFPVSDRGLCFIGPHGIGKTHLAVGVLKSVVRRTGARGLFYDTTDLLRQIRSTYNRDVRATEMDFLRPVMDAELLVLDDMGKEKNSDWVEETMTLIVNTRYNQRRLTIFTSNFLDTPDFEDPNSLVVRVGSRIRSRLHEMCEFVEFDGADYRLIDHPDPSPEDLHTMWKTQRRPSRLPSRAGGPARAQLRDNQDKRELKWPGGKAGH